MQRLVIYQDGLFNIRDDQGRWFMLLDRDDARCHAGQAEIREAVQRHEAAAMPLPQYNAAEDAYYWDDPEEIWSAEDVAADVRQLWPLMDVDALLESSRLMAKLGIKD